MNTIRTDIILNDDGTVRAIRYAVGGGRTIEYVIEFELDGLRKLPRQIAEAARMGQKIHGTMHANFGNESNVFCTSEYALGVAISELSTVKLETI